MNAYMLRISVMTLLSLALTVACAGSMVQAQETMADFSSGPPSGQYSFASWTPKTFPDLFKGSPSGKDVNITGHLFLPPGSEKVAAVVLMHGSGGIYNAMLDFWPKLLNTEGIAVLAIDRFGPRGVKSTAEDQSQVPFAADVADAFAALKLMATHPRIDPKRIAIMGFSRGGIATWRTGVERIITEQKQPNGLRFAAHVPIYSGGCVGAFRLIVKPGVFSKSPMLWIHGDADNYTGITPCQDYADKIAKAGTPVEFVVIKGARHKFDSDDQKHYDIRGATRTLDSCSVEVDIDTLASYDRFTGQRLAGEVLQDTLKKSCSAVGASVEGDFKARDKAAQAVTAFFRKVFTR